MRPGRIGKSTVARQLEQQGMTRLSFDQEAWSRGITTMPLPGDVHRDIEHALRGRLADLVRAGQTWSSISPSGPVACGMHTESS